MSSAVVVTGVAVALGLAGCGGSDTVTETVTTGSPASTATLTPTAPASTASTAPPTTAPTTTAPPGALSESRDLPPQDAVAGVRAGTVKTLATAKQFVDALYAEGDPGKPAAQTRFENAGYAGGILRDQLGETPETDIALLRTYALALRDPAAAQGEVDAGADEIRRTTQATITDIDLPDIPGARGLRVEIDQAGTKGSVVFITFAAGSDVYGLQGVSKSGAALPQDEIVGAARDLYEKVTAAP